MEKRKDGRLWATIGEIEMGSPVMPPRAEFLNHDVKDKKAQKWTRDFPDEETLEYDYPRGSAQRKELLQREVKRRREGVWFLNCGEPTYITGIHYFYLTHYVLPGGFHPDYRDVDQEFFWWWNWIENDPKTLGGIFITRRQQGKTAKAACVMLEHVTRTPRAFNGIQSKSEQDAKDVFTEFIAGPLQDLSSLLRPKDNLSHGDPKKEIVFSDGGRRLKAGESAAPSLRSKINYRNSKDNAYDGKKLTRGLSDEIFKTQEYDPEQRWKIWYKFAKQQGVAVGKYLLTSTVEEKGDTDAQRARRMWKQADPTARLANGETHSGLVRLFQPAYRGYLMDEYGRDRVADSKADLDAKRESLKDDPEELRKFCRANPYTIKESLDTAGKNTFLNTEHINRALSTLAELDKPVTVRGNLSWLDERRDQAVFTPDKENGRFLFAAAAIPQPDELNRVQVEGTVITSLGQQTKFRPLNDVRFAIACDPIDKTKTVDAGSKFAAHAYRKLDPIYEAEMRLANGDEAPGYWPTDGFICEYLCRVNPPRVHYEDMVLLCHFLGCQILFENQKDKLEDHFKERGYGLFLAARPQTTAVLDAKQQRKKKAADVAPGIAASPEAKRDYYEYKIDFSNGQLSDYRRCPFPETLNQDLDFDIEDTKPFDASVSAGYTLMLARRYVRAKPKPVDYSSLSLSNFFHTH